MNYTNPRLISALSAEYVLGTLRGKARDRFESLKFNNTDIKQEVEYWEYHLNVLSYSLESVTPGDSVWHGIQLQLGLITKETPDLLRSSDSSGNVSDILSQQKTSPKKWQWLTGLATAACLILAVLLVRLEYAPVDKLQSVAVITNENAKTLWSFDILGDKIRVKTTNFVPQLSENDYQLWIVPASGDAPISIGLMQQSGEYLLNKPEIFDQIEVAALAVSKEPKGGSLNGAPTEVLYAAELASI